MPAKRSNDRTEKRDLSEPVVGDIFRQRPLAPDPSAPIPAAFVRSPSWHPFLYRKRIERVEKARPGDLVAVYGPNDRVLGYGLYNPRSEIAVRMVFYGEELPDDAAWQKKLDEAVTLRRDMLRLDDVTDAYRADPCRGRRPAGPGGRSPGRRALGRGLHVGHVPAGRSDPCPLGPRAGHAVYRRAAQPAVPQPGRLRAAGLRLGRLAAGSHDPRVSARGSASALSAATRRASSATSGRTASGWPSSAKAARCLDLCCYTGGFAVQAKCLGKAAEVTGVDLDEEPLKLARENANLNQARVRFVQDDAFAYMREMLRLDRRYDVVVLDPPKLIRSRDELEEGTRKHFDLNRLAMRLVKPGGLFLSCCCSGLLKEADFVQLLRQSAYQAGELISAATEETAERHAARPMQILARSGAAADHPVSATVPETEYLKAVWMRIG